MQATDKQVTSLTSPTWRFPPRNGGIDYVNDPSSTHFSDAPIAKLVRELIQNSLDAKHDGFADPVTVTFSETTVKRGLIGGMLCNAIFSRAWTGQPTTTGRTW